MSKKTKSELELIHGEELKLSKAGGWHSVKTGRIVVAPEKNFSTPGQSAKALESRHSKLRAGGEAGVLRATERDNLPDAFGDIIEAQTKLSLSGKRESTGAAKLVIKSLDIVPKQQTTLQEAMTGGGGEKGRIIALLVASLKPHMFDDDDVIDVPVESE